MSILGTLVYFCDVVCRTPYAQHMAVGVFVGLLFGFARPAFSFWAATFLGTGKETVDYFKHIHESHTFNYLTDAKYGIMDGVQDLAFWIIGGYLAYRLLRKGHELVIKKTHAVIVLNSIKFNSWKWKLYCSIVA